jgi:hypothetical protein
MGHPSKGRGVGKGSLTTPIPQPLSLKRGCKGKIKSNFSNETFENNIENDGKKIGS